MEDFQAQEATFTATLDFEAVQAALSRFSRRKRHSAVRFHAVVIAHFIYQRTLRGKRAHMLGEAWLADYLSLTPVQVKHAKALLVREGVIRVWKPASKADLRPAIYVVCDSFLSLDDVYCS